jgi:hypothetical protein
LAQVKHVLRECHTNVALFRFIAANVRVGLEFGATRNFPELEPDMRRQVIKEKPNRYCQQIDNDVSASDSDQVYQAPDSAKH